MVNKRNNSLNHYQNFKITKKNLSDFVDSFDKLTEILNERYQTRCCVAMSPESPPIVGVGGGSMIGPIKNEPDSFSLDSSELRYKKSKKDKRRQMEREKYSLCEDLKRLVESVESGNCSFISMDYLLEFYNKMDEYQTKVIELFCYPKIENDNEFKREHTHNLERISAVKQKLRRQMARKFLQMVAPFNKNTITHAPQHSERIINSGKTINLAETTNIEHLNEILQRFMSLFTPSESRHLFVQFLAQRRQKMSEVFRTTRLSLSLIEILVEREVYFIDKWFGTILFKQFTSDMNIALSERSLIDKEPSIDFFSLNKQVPKEMTIFRCYIYSLLKICFESFNDDQVLNFIDSSKQEVEKMMSALSINISENRIKIIAKIIYEDVLREMRERKLQRDGILEL